MNCFSYTNSYRCEKWNSNWNNKIRYTIIPQKHVEILTVLLHHNSICKKAVLSIK